MKLSELTWYKPELKTKPKEDDSTWDAIIDPFIAGTGRIAEDFAGTFFRKTRGDRDPEEYRNDPDFSSMRALEDWGREVRESHTHEYEPQTFPWYLQQAAESVPEMLGIMGASALAGTAVAPVVGTAGGTALGLLRSAPVIGRGVTSLGKAIQAYLKGNSTGSKVARAFTPRDARTFSATEIGAGLEAELEAQGVYNQAIDAGMSVEDAERAAADARLKNFGIISFMGTPTYNYLFSSPARRVLGMARPTQQGLLGKAGKFTGYNVLPEGIEEGLQEIANQSALPFGYDPQQIRDSFIVGSLLGFGGGGVGAIGNRAINGAPPSYEEQLEAWTSANKIHSENEANRYARKKYETQHGDEIRRQSQYDATKEQYARYRDWARDKTGNQMDDETFNLIVQAANRHGVPVEHALAQAFAESNGRQDVTSEAGAIGVMQIMPETAAGLGVDPRNLEQNIDGGVRYLKDQYDATGNWTLAHAAYNAGLGAVQRYGGVPNYDETQDYVAKINDYLRDTDSARDKVTAINRNIGDSTGFVGDTRARDILGVENYNMPTQGSNIDAQVANLKEGWQSVIPQIGGALREKFGINAEISSAARTAEHNAEVGGVSTSHHIIREGGGDALDIVFDRDTTSDEQHEIAEYFRKSGLFKEVLYHDVGSGAHLHLGGLNTENLGNKRLADDIYNRRIDEGVQRELEEIRKPKEPEKPLFDINAEDQITPKLIEQFLTNTANNAITQNDAQTLEFINPLFDGNTFQDTPENRQAALDRYGDELINFIQGNSPNAQPAQTQTPKGQTSPTQQSVQPKNKKQAIAREVRSFLEELRQSNDQNKGQVVFQLQEALNQGKLAEVEKILTANGRTIQQPQPTQPNQPSQPTQTQQQPVSKNKPPQNTLTQPKLTQEFRNSVSSAVTDFINRIAPDINNGVTLAPNDQSFFESLLGIQNKHGNKIESYDDKTILEIAKGLKKIGVNIDVPQVDIAGANKQNLQQLQGLLPLQTRLQQALDQAEQKRREAAISGTISLQAQEQAQQAQAQARQKQEQARQKQTQLSQEAIDEGLLAQAKSNPTYTGFQEEEAEKERQQEEERQRQAKQDKELQELRARQAEEARLRAESQKPREYPNVTSERSPTADEEDAEYQRLKKEEQDKQYPKKTEAEKEEQNIPYRIAAALGFSNTNSEALQLIRSALATPTKENRHQIAKQILQLINHPKTKEINEKITHLAGLHQSLEAGKIKAILKAQDIIKNTFRPSNRQTKTENSQPAPVDNAPDVQEKVQETQEEIQGETLETQSEQSNQAKQAELKRLQDVALSEPTNDKKENKIQARAILNMLKFPSMKDLAEKIKRDYGLVDGLKKGRKTSIRRAQEILTGFAEPQTEAEKAHDRAAREIAGRNILRSLNTPELQLASTRIEAIHGLKAGLSKGSKEAIREAKRIINETQREIVEQRRLNNRKKSEEQSQTTPQESPQPVETKEFGTVLPLTESQTEEPAPTKEPTPQQTQAEPQTEAPKAGNVVTFKRKGTNASELKEGRKAILNAPDGTTIKAEYGGFGNPNTTGTYVIRNGKLQMLDENGRNYRQAYALTQGNMRKFFSDNNTYGIEVTYSEGQGQYTQPEAPKTKESQDETKGKHPTEKPKKQISDEEYQRIKAEVDKQNTINEADNLEVNDELREKLYKKFPKIKELIDVLIEKGQKPKPAERIPAANWSFVKKQLASLLVGDISENQQVIGATNLMYHVFEKEKLHGKVSNSIAIKNSKAHELLEKGRTGELAPQEVYSQVGKLLYPKNFSKQTEDVKHSKQGSDVDTRIDNFVEDKDLTPQQKLLKSFGDMLGVKTVFFRNEDGNFHGAHDGNITYINVNSNKPLGKVFWHEALHWLKANNPELYQQLVKAAGITDAQRQAYLEETGRTDLEDDAAIDEEILADQMEDAAKRTGLFQSIAGKNRGLIQRVIQWLKDTMNKFIDHFRNPQGKLTTKQAQAFADEFGRIANQLVDPNGQKIFRYNRRTRNVELADGRQLSETPFSEKELRERVAKGEREGTIKYSVGNNNNSNESLLHKIKNAVSSFFSKPQKRRRKAITDNLRRLRGYRILYGYVDGADDIVVDNLQKLIQSRNAYDFEKLLPVVGEGIAKNLKLNPTQAQSNYIADWLMTGALTNTTSPEAQAFAKAMRDNPAMAEILIETQDIFKELANMDAWDSVKSTIAHRQNKTFWEKIKFFGKNFTEETLDDLHPLQEIVDKAIKQATPAVAEMIKRGVNVKQLAQLSRGRGATADMMINGNADEIAKVREELATQYVGCYFDDFKTMKMIIESVGGDWKGLEAFALAKLSKEMIEKNRANPNDEQYTPYMSEAKADNIIQTGEAKFGQAQKDLVRFSKILAAMQYDAGLLTDATFARFMKGWKEYIPTPRVFDENEDYNKLDFMKAKKGHTDDTWSPVQTIMANTHKIIQACERNKVKLEIASLVRFGGFDSNLSETPTGNPDNDNIIRFKENGKMKYLETPDPAIKRAIDAMQDKSEGNWLTKMLRATSGFIRAAYTMFNPDFAAGNIFRDLPDAFIHNKQLGDTRSIAGMVQAWSAMIKALPSAFSEARQAFWNGKFSNDFIEWQMNGGAQASFVSEDVDYIQRSIDTATRGKRFSGVLDAFQKFSEFSENVTRLASYKVAKANLAKAGKTGVTGKQLAALAAREASVDFSKAGRATRTLNKGVIFANAAVQGMNQWIEAFREGRKGNWAPMIGKVLRAGVQGVFLALAQAALARLGDDDDKKAYEQAPEWEKETYWILGKFRIPKGMDVGLRLWANLTDELAGVFLDGNSFNGKRLLSTLWQALPSLTATAITPAVEVLQNHSYFRGAPIDPKSEQHLPAHMRYDETTSWVAKQFGDMTGWSPRKIDYLINGYLGFMGRFVTHIPNYTGRLSHGEFPVGWDEFPITRRFVFTPYKNPKIVKDFYEVYEEQEQLYNEYKLTKERPKGYDPALHRRIKDMYSKFRELSRRGKTILSNPDLSHDERKEKLREIEKRRVALAERVLQGAR